MIVGLGCDLIRVARLETAIGRQPRLLGRLFTPEEQAQGAGRAERLAGTFAAKEACLKALGSGLAGCRWTDVEVLRRPSGEPWVRLEGGAAARAAARGIRRLHVSISHDGGLALAQAVAEG